jgi:Uma2 family endonuclease
LVLEILLPFNDPAEKRKIYKEAAVKEIWWVDPLGERIILDRRGAKRYGTGIFTQGCVESTVLAGLRLDTAWLWSDPLPNEMQCLRDILA